MKVFLAISVLAISASAVSIDRRQGDGSCENDDDCMIPTDMFCRFENTEADRRNAKRCLPSAQFAKSLMGICNDGTWCDVGSGECCDGYKCITIPPYHKQTYCVKQKNDQPTFRVARVLTARNSSQSAELWFLGSSAVIDSPESSPVQTIFIYFLLRPSTR